MAPQSIFEMTVKKADEILDLGPTIVSVDDHVRDIVEKVVKNPAAYVIAVLKGDETLIGVISLRKLIADVFRELTLEDYLSGEMVLGKVLKFFRESPATARDLMDRPVSVRLDEKVSDAFLRMHKNNLAGIPIVSEKNTVVGYLNMIELLALWLKAQESPKGDAE